MKEHDIIHGLLMSRGMPHDHAMHYAIMAGSGVNNWVRDNKIEILHGLKHAADLHGGGLFDSFSKWYNKHKSTINKVLKHAVNIGKSVYDTFTKKDDNSEDKGAKPVKKPQKVHDEYYHYNPSRVPHKPMWDSYEDV
jgi:hypothetical protein